MRLTLKMKFTANQIAQILEGEIEGDSEAEVSRLSKIEEGIYTIKSTQKSSKDHSKKL